MLACARIGAIHSVVFGGFSADALRSRIDDAEAKLVVTADGTWRRGKPRALKPAVDEALAKEGHTVAERAGGQAQRPGRRLERTAGQVVVRRRRHRLHRAHRRGPRGRAPALRALHLRHHRQAQGHHPHHRRLPGPGRRHPPRHLRPAPRDRRVLVHRRHRLGHRPHLRHLRAADQRRHPGHVRGHPGFPAPGPLVGDHSKVRGHHPLHRPHRHPHVHEVGPADPGLLRPVLAARARLGGRTHQPRGVDVVPRRHRHQQREERRNARSTRPRSWTPGGRPRPART